jgi:DNA helicase HerA-like ATPase
MQATPGMPEHLTTDGSIGRIVSVTGARAIVLLDYQNDLRPSAGQRPEMGTLLAIDTPSTVVLAIVSALNVPVPAQREGETEVWIAELGLVGELRRGKDGQPETFNRGVTIYPALGDRVRVAVKRELEIAFCGDMARSVRVGCIRQDNSIPAMIRVDDLLGKHFAILGTTGTGKSCTTALILRSILEKHPAAHIVLLDPHNEYSSAFSEWGEVVSPRNMQLPFWLLTFEELVEVVIGDTTDKKQEIEMMQELIPIAKSRYSTGRGREGQATRTRPLDSGRFTVDTPVPYRISDLTSLIDERMGKLENKRDIAPYRNLKQRFEALSLDPRYAFMFGSLTVFDGMAQVLSRIFRVPVNGKPITIVELTGLPTEIINVVVSVICRMTFDFALWTEGKVPVTLVCEEAHRYVPANPTLGFEPCKRAIAKIAKEGRKYGASLCIVTQRPAEIDPTILSQCNTVFALRMSNDRDQQIVTSSISDTGSGLLEFLAALGQREAIAFGEGVALPVRIRFDELAKQNMPRSSTAKFSEMWQHSSEDEGFLETVVERWRLSSSGSLHEYTAPDVTAIAVAPGSEGASAQIEFQQNGAGNRPGTAASRQAPGGPSNNWRDPGQSAPGALLRRENTPAPRGEPAPAMPPGASQPGGQGGGSLRTLRDRLAQRR